MLIALCWSADAEAAATPANGRVIHTVFQDDDLALFSSQGLGELVKQLRWLGVDELRVSAEWKLEAPDPDARRAPAGFRSADPRSYDGAGMFALDRAVRAARSAGLGVMLDPAFSAPLWATSDLQPRADPGSAWFNTDIDVNAAAGWEQMLARRYSGEYTPPGATSPLPRVQTFTLWNEPNDHAFLTPQWRGGVPVSADWYRRLVQLAYPAIKRALPSASVLIGNTSESGTAGADVRRGVAPFAFIRRLACVDAELHPVHDGACAKFFTLPADGFAHHPYERLSAPWVPSTRTQADWAQMGDLPRLQSLLEKLVAMRRLAAGAANLWLTEQGYESNAELTDRPWTEAQQAQLNADSEYLGWRDPQLASFSQFLLRDSLTSETLRERARNGESRRDLSGTWTTGLRRENDQPKPALWMFRSPVVARVIDTSASPFLVGLNPKLLGAAAPRLLEVWGRARPLTAPRPVQVQVADGSGRSFQTVATSTTDANGIFDASVAVPSAPSAQVRFRWLGTDGRWQQSPTTVPTEFPVG